MIRDLESEPTGERERIFLIGFIILSAIVVTALLLIVNHENTSVKSFSLSEIEIGDNANVRYEIEKVGKSRIGHRIKGWFIDDTQIYDYYNYGNDYHGKGQYTNFRICLIEDDKAYVLPTKLSRRDDVSLLTQDEDIKIGYNGFLAYIPEELNVDEAVWGVLTKDLNGNKKMYIFE